MVAGYVTVLSIFPTGFIRLMKISLGPLTFTPSTRYLEFLRMISYLSVVMLLSLKVLTSLLNIFSLS